MQKEYNKKKGYKEKPTSSNIFTFLNNPFNLVIIA